jgi:hypothetical protein
MRGQPELGYTWYQGGVISVCAKTILIPSLQWAVALNVAMVILMPKSGKVYSGEKLQGLVDGYFGEKGYPLIVEKGVRLSG